MDNNKKLFEGLLKADGIDPSNITESERMVFRQMLDREKKRMKNLSSLTVGAEWIFALAMIGLCLYEKIFEALRIPFVVGCLVIMAATLIIMIRYTPGHNRRLRESGRKINKLYYLVYGKHMGIPLVGKKDGKRFIYWPRIIMIAAGLWLITSLAGAGVYYLLCQRWIYSSGPMLHIFYSTVISLSLVIFILRDGLKTALDDLTEVKTKSKKSELGSQPDIWRIIMRSKITKLAAVAVIIIGVLIGINHFDGSIDGTSVAWGEIVRRIENVDYLHYYEVTNSKDGFPSIREVWYSAGQLRTRSCGGFNSYGSYQSFDDGTTWSVFDRHNNVTCVGESSIAKYDNIFEAMTDGVLSFNNLQFQNKTPSLVGTDFLIYDFEPPAETDWVEKISVTVGRNSLIPIQIKTYFKAEQWYSISHLVLFDYEESPKPVDFFDPPTETKSPHGIGHVVLGGEEVEIELHDTPGIKKAIVRLHTKFDGPAEDLLIPYRERYKIIGGPIYFMEITFIIDEGYRSNTSTKCPLWIDQGVKAALGKKDTWPDRKYRNIRYTPVLRATDKQDEFILELSCWLRTKQPDL